MLDDAQWNNTVASLCLAGRYSLYFAFLWCYFLPATKSELLALNNQLVFGPRGCRGGSHSGERELCRGLNGHLRCLDLTVTLWEHFANMKRENPIFHSRKISQLSLTNTLQKRWLLSKVLIRSSSWLFICISQPLTCWCCGCLINILSLILFLTNTTGQLVINSMSAPVSAAKNPNWPRVSLTLNPQSEIPVVWSHSGIFHSRTTSPNQQWGTDYCEPGIVSSCLPPHCPLSLTKSQKATTIYGLWGLRGAISCCATETSAPGRLTPKPKEASGLSRLLMCYQYLVQRRPTITGTCFALSG